MLLPALVKEIEDFVYEKPRSVQEISSRIKKNWRTADRYVDDIEKNFGTITTRVFREGTRGALKIVYWSSVEKISPTVFQQKLEDEILRARRKEDFSAFDIFQYVKDSHKTAKVEFEKEEEAASGEQIAPLLMKAKKQLLIFSGNLSFINFRYKGRELFDVMEDLVKKGVTIRAVCRVDLSARKNIDRMLSLNHKYGRELIEIHHKEHPLRATIFDDELIHLKEIKFPTKPIRPGEFDKNYFIFYNIKDKEWAEWLKKIFWKVFNSSIDSKTRVKELEKLHS